jgi:hypothetical protein
MIIRRISGHLREQNWTAITIEFVLLVVGVFLGIQVANWNEVRLDRIEACRVLQRLDQEFRMHLERTERSLERHRTSLAATARVIHGIRNARLEEDTLGNDIDLVTGFATPPGPSTTFQELISSGRLGLLRDTQLRAALLGYNDYVSLVRSHYDVFTRPLIDARAGLLRARTLLVTGEPSAKITDAWATGSVDHDMLLTDREVMVALQMAYGTQDNIHAVLRANRERIVEILELIAVEKGRAL